MRFTIKRIGTLAILSAGLLFFDGPAQAQWPDIQCWGEEGYLGAQNDCEIFDGECEYACWNDCQNNWDPQYCWTCDGYNPFCSVYYDEHEGWCSGKWSCSWGCWNDCG